MVNKVINGLGSPLLVLVVLGMFKHRLRANSVFWGVIIGTLFSISTALFVEHLALHYYAVVNLFATVAICYILDFVFQKNRLTAVGDPTGESVGRPSPMDET